MTAVILVSGSPRALMQQKSTTAALAAPHVHDVPFSACQMPTANHDMSYDAAALAVSLVTSSVITAAPSLTTVPSSSSPAKTTSQAPSPAATTIKEGVCVRIEGLQAAPEMNGRTGVVCGALDQESGRWMIEIDADGARPASRGHFRPANLRTIPSHNFSTEWVDVNGCVWPKNVDFSRQCAKGHALVPLGDCGGDGGGKQLMCRMCHSYESSSWLACSVDSGCCEGYTVCRSCAHAPDAAAVASAGSDDFRTLVSCGLSALCCASCV